MLLSLLHLKGSLPLDRSSQGKTYFPKKIRSIRNNTRYWGLHKSCKDRLHYYRVHYLITMPSSCRPLKLLETKHKIIILKNTPSDQLYMLKVKKRLRMSLNMLLIGKEHFTSFLQSLNGWTHSLRLITLRFRSSWRSSWKLISLFKTTSLIRNCRNTSTIRLLQAKET